MVFIVVFLAPQVVFKPLILTVRCRELNGACDCAKGSVLSSASSSALWEGVSVTQYDALQGRQTLFTFILRLLPLLLVYLTSEGHQEFQGNTS